MKRLAALLLIVGACCIGCENETAIETTEPEAYQPAQADTAYQEYEYADADVPPPSMDIYIPPPPPMPAAAPADEMSYEPAPLPPSQPTRTSAQTVHVVQRGETLWRIMRQYYGEANNSLKQQIVDANPGLNPDLIYPGQEIVIPEQ